MMHSSAPALFLLGVCLCLLPCLAAADEITAQIILTIAPGSESCAGSSSDCRTASQAAPFINRAMSTYGIQSKNEMAAIIALMAFESGELKYKHNIWPGRAGQGTSNMQMAQWNLLYAKSIPQVSGEVARYTSTDGLSDAQLNEILSYVTPDEYNFGSAAWYLTRRCDGSVRETLRANVDSGFEAYMRRCVGVEVTQDRLAYLYRAKQAFRI